MLSECSHKRVCARNDGKICSAHTHTPRTAFHFLHQRRTQCSHCAASCFMTFSLERPCESQDRDHGERASAHLLVAASCGLVFASVQQWSGECLSTMGLWRYTNP